MGAAKPEIAPAQANEAAPSLAGARDADPSTTRPISLETAAPIAPNTMPVSAPSGDSAARSSYPTTGASGLNPLATPIGQRPRAPISGGYGQPSATWGPAPGVGVAAAGPAPTNPFAYPNTSVPPSSGYPTTGASAAPFPNYEPSAMNPRYERIR
jgi:hypothetical protein